MRGDRAGQLDGMGRHTTSSPAAGTPRTLEKLSGPGGPGDMFVSDGKQPCQLLGGMGSPLAWTFTVGCWCLWVCGQLPAPKGQRETIQFLLLS